MKLALYYGTCLLAVLVQITLLGGNVSLNIVLATIIASAVFCRASDVIPIALLCGLLLDLHSGMFFGFNIFFLLFAVLIAKLVLHLGERASGFWNVIVTLGILEILQLFVQFVFIFSTDKYTQIGSFFMIAFWQLVLTLTAGAAIYGGFVALQDYLGGNGIKKHWLWGK